MMDKYSESSESNTRVDNCGNCVCRSANGVCTNSKSCWYEWYVPLYRSCEEHQSPPRKPEKLVTIVWRHVEPD